MPSNIAERTWFHDLEIVNESTRGYALMIKDLSVISGIPIGNISETWSRHENELPEIRIAYSAKGRSHTFYLTRHSDFISPEAIFMLNQQLFGPEYKLEISFNESCVYLLSEEEKIELKSKGIMFESTSPLSYFELMLINAERLLVLKDQFAYHLLQHLNDALDDWKNKNFNSGAYKNLKKRLSSIFSLLDWEFISKNEINIGKLGSFVEKGK